MMDAIYDPFTIDLARQWESIAPLLDEAAHARITSSQNLTIGLSNILHDSRYTTLVATKFRPVLFVLCAIWIDQGSDLNAKLAALAFLLHSHEELFPILFAFICNSQFSGGLLSNYHSMTISQLHRQLLSYFRILFTCPSAPILFEWDTHPLPEIISDANMDNGVRYLAAYCYSICTRKSDAEREELLQNTFGSRGEAVINIQDGFSPDGSSQYLDGWFLPALEVLRIRRLRNSVLQGEKKYHLNQIRMSSRSELEMVSSRVANIHGVLLLKKPGPSVRPLTKLVPTASAISAIRAIAIRISRRLAILLSSPASSGKSLLVNHLADTLYPSSLHQVVTLHLSDTSLDAKSLLGSYVSSTKHPGTFEWQEGVVIHAMRHGLWLVLEDIDRASSDVLGTLLPLIESLTVHKHIGAPAYLDIPGHERVNASESFAIFATRSVQPNPDGNLPPASFLGSHKYSQVDLPAPTIQDLNMILSEKFHLLGTFTVRAVVYLWSQACSLGSAPGCRIIGIRELETWCRRLENFASSSVNIRMETDEEMNLEKLYPHTSVREEMFLQARDIFFGEGSVSETSRIYLDSLARLFARHLGLDSERVQWILEHRTPHFHIERHDTGDTKALIIGKNYVLANSQQGDGPEDVQRPFAMHRPALLLMERLLACILPSEPVLLVGETGTGKTTTVSYLASLLNRRLVSLNLSHQTESSDLLGGFKPVDARIPAGELQGRFLDLFSKTFSKRKNSKFEDAVRKAFSENRWKRTIHLWQEAIRLALDKIHERNNGPSNRGPEITCDNPPRKRRKLDGGANVQESEWMAFSDAVDIFEIQHVRSQGKFAFGFVEGPLISALRNGDWVLLDEINLASPEALECIYSILQGPTASIVLSEQGSFTPIPRHTNFRLFACMNPATDVGKRDLPPHIRSRFTELYMAPPDSDKNTLLSVVQQYIGHCSLGDKSVLLDIVNFYTEVRGLAERHELADGTNNRPQFNMRTLARALTFTSDTVSSFGLRRALWEGCLMTFSMALDGPSVRRVHGLAEKHILAPFKSVAGILSQMPAMPIAGAKHGYEKIGPFWLKRGDLEPDSYSEYILTASVQTKLVDLARIILTRRFPVLIEGPTSSGKTSIIEYLARRTGHRFVRVNNHEHTDIQEYLGTYVSDPHTGKLVYHDGILVRALRHGDWIVLDELNLAPTDVLEALNRLLDDNRELVIPETQEVVKPHPQFMLFATQNPSGLYGGRKVLSRAFRNRFLEIHFDDVPQHELQVILSERCRIPESYAKRIVNVFEELSKRRQKGRIFESKHGFATLRDLFRWAGRGATSTRELAQHGYMLLAERARRTDDKEVVREVLEQVFKERIDPESLYTFSNCGDLGVSVPTSGGIIWTSAMRRLFILLANALKFNEPVLLVGETGSGKTSVCQIYADAVSKSFIAVNCHQGTETSDLIGGLRPVRNRMSTQADLVNQVQELFQTFSNSVDIPGTCSRDMIASLIGPVLNNSSVPPEIRDRLLEIYRAIQQSQALFEWQDGPLIRAMRHGDIFLLDEISLADDSVLERLNSVLEPSRSITLAERGGMDLDGSNIVALHSFQILATMNPGGDYGKKELSPALRNRFTEIWVPPVTSRADLHMIIDKSWCHNNLCVFTERILDFGEWLSHAVGSPACSGLRDILAWVQFMNIVSETRPSISMNLAFHHAAHLVVLDGLETNSFASLWSTESLDDLRSKAQAYLNGLAPLGGDVSALSDAAIQVTNESIFLGPFSITKGPYQHDTTSFSVLAPTALDNMRRLVRACQLFKPILLEGSPGVGKTSLVVALGNLTGHRVSRINLSDQSDITDLFGSDLPVEGGAIGEFAWKDAAFLQAMQNGDWVLLDEMNLAPQAVLEGLNAILDHRGTVYIPELGRSFTKHPQFRIFSAQNPLYQGGGRKGLPKSFLDRFIKVYIRQLTYNDLLKICQSQFPTLSDRYLRSIIHFNFRLHADIMVNRLFGTDGSPWEFNLRDIVRWASLLVKDSDLLSDPHPADYLDVLYLQRFRTESDRVRVLEIFRETFHFTEAKSNLNDSLWLDLSPSHMQVGSLLSQRGRHLSFFNAVELQSNLTTLAAAAICLQQGWLLILSGSSGSGKTHLIRHLANQAGCRLEEVSMSSSTDTSDILGSFEQNITSDGGTRFEWVDGPLIRAMKTGYWIVFDNANLCNASVLDRLNSVCEMNGSLVLTERGHIHGEIEILRPHTCFRLIFLIDPRNGELSRAMRNRGVEIHIQKHIQPCDFQRLLEAARTPPFMFTDSTPKDVETTALEFELVRRGNLANRFGSTLGLVFRTGLLNADSLSSSLLDFLVLFSLPVRNNLAELLAHVSSIIRLLPPPLLRLIYRGLDVVDWKRFDVEQCTFLLRPLLQQRGLHGILSLRKSLGETLMLKINIFPHFIKFQPLDLIANPKLSSINRENNTFESDGRLLSEATQLLVHWHFQERLYTPVHISSVFFDSQSLNLHEKSIEVLRLGVSSIYPLCAAITELVQTTLENLHLGSSNTPLPQIRILRDFVDLGAHLRRISSGPHFDFSSARVISKWFQRILSNNPAFLDTGICRRIDDFMASMELSSGQAMEEIWHIFMLPALSERIHVTLNDLKSLSSCINPENLDYAIIRSELFNMMAILDCQSYDVQKPLPISVQDIRKKLSSSLIDAEQTFPNHCSGELAIAELRLLTDLSRNLVGQKYQNLFDFIISLAAETCHADLTHLTAIQHCVWAVGATNESNYGHRFYSEFLSSVQQWMALSCGLSIERFMPAYGGLTLFTSPVLLSGILDLCCGEYPLHALEKHESHLQLEAQRLNIEIEDISLDRLTQISLVFSNMTHILASCFKETYAQEVWKKIVRFSTQGSLHELAESLCESSNSHFSQLVHARLLPITRKLNQVDPNEHDISRAKSLGQAWIELALLLLELYVPNIPLDPLAAQYLTSEIWSQRKSMSMALLRMQEFLHTHFTGHTGQSFSLPQPQREHFEIPYQNFPPLNREVNIAHLHALFEEISPFLSKVIFSSKFNSLVKCLAIGLDDMKSEVLTILATIDGFLLRLERSYSKLKDIVQPIRVALTSLQFGLRLLDDHVSHMQRADGQYLHALIGFPTGVISMPIMEGFPEVVWSTKNLLLDLLALVYDFKFGSGSTDNISRIEEVYRKLVTIWLEDIAQQKRRKEEEEALYRHKSTQQADNEVEDEEFLALFPDFGNQTSQHNKNGAHQNVLSAQEKELLYRLHWFLADPSVASSRSTIRDEFTKLRTSCLRDLTVTQLHTLPSSLDTESVAFQISLLSKRFNEMHEDVSQRVGYDFYHDPNIPQVRQILPLLRALHHRLQQLTSEWPDQMVLQHITASCDAVLQLHINSPIAQVLTTLEQLVLRIEDWEVYANKNNSLKGHQDTLKGFIIQWRRLELSCWSQLLYSQEAIFSSAVSEWWIRLYELAIAGTIAAVNENIPLDDFFRNLVSLIDEFVTSSPIGQFLARLQLVQSFEAYARLLSNCKNDRESSAFARVSRLLRNVHGFYCQFSHTVSQKLSEHRAPLEKGLADYITLASWRDTNVHALRESAQRTHRQLFKCVKKLREVLREPTPLGLLTMPVDPCPDTKSPGLPGLESVPITTGYQFFEDTDLYTGNMPQYMCRLPETYNRFQQLLRINGNSLIEVLSRNTIDDFAGQILQASSALSTETDAAGSDMHLHRTLIMRKRKAWSDLLSELKKIGLSSKPRPNVVSQLRDKVYLYGLPMIRVASDSFHLITGKCQRYINGMLQCLPQLQKALSSHHPDLTTSEIQRGIGLVESCFSVSLATWARFTQELGQYEDVKNATLRLLTLSKTEGVIYLGFDISTTVKLISQLDDALQEIVQGTTRFTSLPGNYPISSSIQRSMAVQLQRVQEARQISNDLKCKFTSMHEIFMTSEEFDSFKSVVDILTATKNVLKTWVEGEPRVRHLCSPLLTWLTEAVTLNTLLPRTSANRSSAEAPHSVIRRLLMVVQDILSAVSLGSCIPQGDQHVKICQAASGEISRVIAVSCIRNVLVDFINGLAPMPDEERRPAIKIIVPFLLAYLRMAEKSLIAQAEACKSLMKLSYVVSRIILSLAEKGFCKPADNPEDNATESSREVQEGTGLGGGTGTEDISEQIQDPDQVEGLRGEESTEEASAESANEEGMEVDGDGDLSGNMQDINDRGSDMSNDTDDEVDDAIDKVEPDNMTTIDEKLWGNEDPTERGKSDESVKPNAPNPGSTGELGAKEQQAQASEQLADAEQPSSPQSNKAESQEEELNIDAGKKMDDFVSNADKLDLPDDLNFPNDLEEKLSVGPENEVHDEIEEPMLSEAEAGADDIEAIPESPPCEFTPAEEIGDKESSNKEQGEEVSQLKEDSQTDTGPGDELAEKAGLGKYSSNDLASDPLVKEQEQSSTEQDANAYETSRHQDVPLGHAGQGGMGVTQERFSSQQIKSLPNPLRSLGDTLKEIQRRWDNIRDVHQPDHIFPLGDPTSSEQMEFVPEGMEEDKNTQALGPAGEEHVASLRDLNIHEEPSKDTTEAAANNLFESDLPMEEAIRTLQGVSGDELKNDFNDASAKSKEDVKHQVQQDVMDVEPNASHLLPGGEMHVSLEEEEVIPKPKSVEIIVKEWQEAGHPDSSAKDIWQLYDSLTRELSFTLCEQLRLILEPTLATRLKGDYRTGKRINMKKIIPYIASEFTKDKIWLRRTRPSQREYQVLIAVDDSHSMAESRSVHLAYETLALMSKALNRLESGEVAIARFGESVEIVHSFEDGMVGDREGEAIMRKFRFQQRKTDVFGLLETSLQVLSKARERRLSGRSSHAAQDLWQLEIIISDGICQNHDLLRPILRRAEECRVMVVFVILDSLHAHNRPLPNTESHIDSILSMNQVSYKDVGGRMELQLTRYMDSFPFQYYVILRDIEALPDVLSGTLKQFLQRISEA